MGFLAAQQECGTMYDMRIAVGLIIFATFVVAGFYGLASLAGLTA